MPTRWRIARRNGCSRRRHGRAGWRSLSGGATPRRLYEELALLPYRDAFPWSRTHWFWGDERFVPPDDAMSNYRMVHEALLSQAPIAADHIHAVPTVGMTPEAAASAYERYPPLESTRHAAFLVAGAEKRAAVAALRRCDMRLPATRFHPAGTLHVFTDVAAAGQARAAGETAAATRR
jgi:6-phosphogluconolactonase/glucosamine-6-phosphate isomerase/deaminase